MKRVIMILLHSATNTHIQHLQTKSYAEHMALGAYYVGIVTPVDSLVETVQGLREEIITGYPLENVIFNEGLRPLEYMKMVREEFLNHRDSFPENGQVQNILDTIGELLDGTIYKLTFLR
jgi:hypothetical protein